MLVYILNPSLEDLLTSKVYKLEIGSDVFLVPLWHSELYFFKTKEIVVLCEPQLPDGVDIDEQGNVYTTVKVDLCDLEIGGVIRIDMVDCCIDVDQLLIKREQLVRIKNKGLPVITDNIYDRTAKADIVVKVIIR
jgi:hypothetical protein